MNCPVCSRPMNGEVCEHCFFTLRPIRPKLNINKSREIKSLDPNQLYGVDLLYYHLSENALEREGEKRSDTLLRKRTEHDLEKLFSDVLSSKGDTTLIIDELSKIENKAYSGDPVTETIDMGEFDDYAGSFEYLENNQNSTSTISYDDFQASALIDAILDRDKTNFSSEDTDEEFNDSDVELNSEINFPELDLETEYTTDGSSFDNENLNAFYDEPDPVYEPDYPGLNNDSTNRNNSSPEILSEDTQPKRFVFKTSDQVYNSEVQFKDSRKCLKKLIKEAGKNPVDEGEAITEFLSGSVIVEGKTDDEAKKRKNIFVRQSQDGIDSVPDLFYDSYFREFEKPKEDTAREQKRKKTIFACTAGGLIMVVIIILFILQFKNYM